MRDNFRIEVVKRGAIIFALGVVSQLNACAPSKSGTQLPVVMEGAPTPGRGNEWPDHFAPGTTDPLVVAVVTFVHPNSP
jgi:hypothetical protein